MLKELDFRKAKNQNQTLFTFDKQGEPIRKYYLGKNERWKNDKSF